MKSLIDKYIEEKINNYCEPPRKRRTKGEKIDFSKEKFKATILAAQGKSPKEISDQLGIPHGTSKNWGIEPDFCNLVERHQDEIAARLLKHSAEIFGSLKWYEDPDIFQEFGSPSDYGEDIWRKYYDLARRLLDQTRSLRLIMGLAQLSFYFYQSDEVKELYPEMDDNYVQFTQLDDFCRMHIMAYSYHLMKKHDSEAGLVKNREVMLRIYENEVSQIAADYGWDEIAEDLLKDESWLGELKFKGKIEVKFKTILK